MPQPLPAAPPIPAQPSVHPDDGKPLGRACKPAARVRVPSPIQGAAWRDEIAAARRQGRAPRKGIKRHPVIAPHRCPTVADALRVRHLAHECGVDMAKPGRVRFAGPLLGMVLLLETVLTVPSRSRGRAVDPVAAASMLAPPWFWRLWARIGWRQRWSAWSLRACSRWLGRRNMPAMVWHKAWPRAWARSAWDARTMTAGEWSRRDGVDLPGWMRDWTGI